MQKSKNISTLVTVSSKTLARFLFKKQNTQRYEPGFRIQMPDNKNSFRQNIRNRSLKSLKRIDQILLSAKKANHIRRANLPQAYARLVSTTFPHAQIGLFRSLQRRQGFGDGGVRVDPPKRRLSKAQI